MKRSKSSSSFVRLVVVSVALGVVLVSCSDDDEAQSDVCADREALSESFDALTNLDVVAVGTSGLTAAVSDVEADLAALRTSAGEELQPEVQAVEDDLAQVQTAAAEIDSGGASAAIEALSALAASTETLLSSIEQGACGESTTATT